MKDLLNFLNDSTTAFQAIDEIVKELNEKGYEALDEKRNMYLKKDTNIM